MTGGLPALIARLRALLDDARTTPRPPDALTVSVARALGVEAAHVAMDHRGDDVVLAVAVGRPDGAEGLAQFTFTYRPGSGR